MKKKIKVAICLFALLSIIMFVGEKFSELYLYIDAYELSEIIIIDIENEQTNDYETLANEIFKHIEQSELELLKEYMKKNNLKLKCGTYEVNKSYTYEELIEVFEFE